MTNDVPSATAHALEQPPSEVHPGIWVIRIPLHVRTEPVNAYVLEDVDGTLTVFDTGIAAGAPRLWRDALAALGHAPADVRRIVVSHHHPDHIGGSGALHRLTGAPLLASRSTIQQAPDVWGDGGRMEDYLAAIARHVRDNGLPDHVAAQLTHEHRTIRATIELPPEDAWEPLDEGDRLEVGSRTWRVRLMPGHADGHLVLHDEAGGCLLAGDHLLERISPAVGLYPRHEKDPLGRYLESLMAIAMVDPQLVLPGHGAPFAGAAGRARELLAHHVERVEQCVDAVVRLEEATAWEVAGLVFERVFAAEQPDPANQRFATTEAMAHLERARRDGRVTRARGVDGTVRFRAA